MPNSKREARGRASMGRGMRASMAHPAQEVRGSRSARRPRAHGTYGGLGRGWGTAEERVREARQGGNPPPLLGPVYGHCAMPFP